MDLPAAEPGRLPAEWPPQHQPRSAAAAPQRCQWPRHSAGAQPQGGAEHPLSPEPSPPSSTDTPWPHAQPHQPLPWLPHPALAPYPATLAHNPAPPTQSHRHAMAPHPAPPPAPLAFHPAPSGPYDPPPPSPSTSSPPLNPSQSPAAPPQLIPHPPWDLKPPPASFPAPPHSHPAYFLPPTPLPAAPAVLSPCGRAL